MSPRKSVVRVAQGLCLGFVACAATATPAVAQTMIVPCDPSALASAVAGANSAGLGELELAPGCVYTLSTPLPDITGNVTIDAGGDTITRSASASPFRIFTVDLSGRLTLDQAVVSNGNATGSFGGGIANFGYLDVMHSQIINNTADYSGGLGGVSGAMTIVEGSDVMGNTVTRNGGGMANDGTMTVIRSRVTGNSAGALGGGLANDGSLTVMDSNVNGNTASDGGGIANIGGGDTTVTRSNVDSNTATGGVGAGGVLDSSGTVALSGSRVNTNAPTNCAGTVPGCTG